MYAKYRRDYCFSYRYTKSTTIYRPEDLEQLRAGVHGINTIYFLQSAFFESFGASEKLLKDKIEIMGNQKTYDIIISTLNKYEKSCAVQGVSQIFRNYKSKVYKLRISFLNMKTMQSVTRFKFHLKLLQLDLNFVPKNCLEKVVKKILMNNIDEFEIMYCDNLKNKNIWAGLDKYDFNYTTKIVAKVNLDYEFVKKKATSLNYMKKNMYLNFKEVIFFGKRDKNMETFLLNQHYIKNLCKLKCEIFDTKPFVERYGKVKRKLDHDLPYSFKYID